MLNTGIISLKKGLDKSGQPGLYHKMGKACLQLSRIDQAEKYFEQAVKINPLALKNQTMYNCNQ